MFAQLLQDFDERAKEVELYLQLLCSLDNDEIVIGAGTGPQVSPLGPPPADWGRMLKGGTYLVLYNLVEAFIRRGYQAVFDAVKNDGLYAAELTELFRKQWIAQLNRKVAPFDGSPKKYMEIANEIVNDILNKKPTAMGHRRLPISGNIDDATIREVCELHGVSHVTPAAAKGGSAMSSVKSKRNALAHGDESFVEVGQHLTAAQLVPVKNEVLLYIRSILLNLEEFVLKKSYKL